jgi:hypothetical protein
MTNNFLLVVTNDIRTNLVSLCGLEYCASLDEDVEEFSMDSPYKVG